MTKGTGAKENPGIPSVTIRNLAVTIKMKCVTDLELVKQSASRRVTYKERKG